MGANYFDMDNGTVVVYLPGAVTDYNITVDGTQMQEAKENYTLELAKFVGDAATVEKAITNTISVGTSKTTHNGEGEGDQCRSARACLLLKW